MAISFPINIPTSGIRQTAFIMRNGVSVGESKFTGQAQYQEHSKQFWEATITLPKMTRATAAEWQGFLASLRGRIGTFMMGEINVATARGIATGTPLVKGASQTGNTLITDGWTISITGILLSGDYIQIGNHMYIVVEDANSDGSGDSTLEVWPNLRADVSDTDPIVVASPKGIWRLASNEVSWTIDEHNHYLVSFACRESIND